jgi:hypothetical protein
MPSTASIVHTPLYGRIRRAWEGRISGCQLGKPVELLSMLQGHAALKSYLTSVGSFPVRDYIGYRPDAGIQRACCLAVGAGLDTDCNGATVGGLWGIQGEAIPTRWTAPWQGRVALSLAGYDEVTVASLVECTLRVAATITDKSP